MEPINNNELFPCVIDGAKYGKNGTAYKVFEKIFKLINQEKQYNGIFGNDIEYDIDPKLQSISMDVVLLGSDTAWNMLQQMANFCLSNVFVDRDGKVKVVRDVFVGEDQTPATRNASLQAPSITPNNAFSYDLPAMAKTMVNRAVVPYVVIKEETASETIQTTIEKKDFIIKRDSAGVAKFILAQQKFDSNLFKINDVEIRIDGVFTSISTLKSFKLAFGCIALELDYSVNIKSINIVLLNSENVFKSESQNVLEEDFSCQAQNGVKTFELGCGNLITSLDIAKEVAEKLIANYSKGKTYIESTWIGTPEMKLGLNFTSYSMRDKTPQEYDCLSNEFTITGGMRLRTKARQK